MWYIHGRATNICSYGNTGMPYMSADGVSRASACNASSGRVNVFQSFVSDSAIRRSATRGLNDNTYDWRCGFQNANWPGSLPVGCQMASS